MAKEMLKLFRVATLPATGVVGGLYFVTSEGLVYIYDGTTFKAYSGVRSAAFDEKAEKLTIVQHDGTEVEVSLSGYAKSTDLSSYVKKEQKVAGIDLQNDITVEELKTALGLTAANLAGQANVLEGVKVNGAKLAIADDKTVNVLIGEGSANGTISVNDANVSVHGLNSAAYHAETDFVSSTGYVAYSQAEKNKLEGIAQGAEKNTITTVKVNGEALTVDANRAVDITIPAAAVKGVKSGDKVLALDSTDGKLSTTISMEYKSTSENGDGYIYLKGIDGAVISKINAAEFVKDGMIDTVVMGENNILTITWNTAAGKTEATTIDFSKYIDTFTHYGARNGVKVVEDAETKANYYQGVVDAASETFLTVGANGFKLSGVQSAIDNKIAGLDATVGSKTVAEGKHVAVQVVEADGVLTGVTVTESDIASAAALTALNGEVQEHEQVTAAALNDLNTRLSVLTAGTVSAVDGEEGEALNNTEYVKVKSAAKNGVVALSSSVKVVADVPASELPVKYVSTEATGLATDKYVRDYVAATFAWSEF